MRRCCRWTGTSKASRASCRSRAASGSGGRACRHASKAPRRPGPMPGPTPRRSGPIPGPVPRPCFSTVFLRRMRCLLSVSYVQHRTCPIDARCRIVRVGEKGRHLAWRLSLRTPRGRHRRPALSPTARQARQGCQPPADPPRLPTAPLIAGCLFFVYYVRNMTRRAVHASSSCGRLGLPVSGAGWPWRSGPSESKGHDTQFN